MLSRLGAALWGPKVLTLTGHTDEVYCVAAADDGHVLTGSGDDTVRIFEHGHVPLSA